MTSLELPGELSTEEIGNVDDATETFDEYAEKAAPYVTKGSRWGAFSVVAGTFSLLRALGAFRRRRWLRGFVRLGFAGLWFAVAAVQRRSPAPEAEEMPTGRRDVAGTEPTVGTAESGADEDVEEADVVESVESDLEEVVSDVDEPEAADEETEGETEAAGGEDEGTGGDAESESTDETEGTDETGESEEAEG